MALGRPTEYDPAYLPKIKELAKAGATMVEIADYIGVSVSTVNRWMNDNKDFRSAIKMGKFESDERVERSLYHRALGYQYETEKIFCDAKTGAVTRVPVRETVPPDTASMIFWLKNRRPNEWREKTEVEVAGLSDLAERLSRARARVQIEQSESAPSERLLPSPSEPDPE